MQKGLLLEEQSGREDFHVFLHDFGIGRLLIIVFVVFRVLLTTHLDLCKVVTWRNDAQISLLAILLGNGLEELFAFLLLLRGFKGDNHFLWLRCHRFGRFIRRWCNWKRLKQLVVVLQWLCLDHCLLS